MRPTVPTELPDFGFITDLDPNKDARIFVIRKRCNKVLEAYDITAPLVDDVESIHHFIYEWGAANFTEMATNVTATAPATDDLDRIKLLVHTAGTAISQAQVILGFEREDDETDWVQAYSANTAIALFDVALNAASMAYHSIKRSQKEKVL